MWKLYFVVYSGFGLLLYLIVPNQYFRTLLSWAPLITTRVRRTTGDYVFTGVCLLTPEGVPHLHPIILPLVPFPFLGVPHLHTIILPLVPLSGGTPVIGPRSGQGVPQWLVPGQDGGGGTPRWGTPILEWISPAPQKVMLGQVILRAVRLLRFPAGGPSCVSKMLKKTFVITDIF